MGLVRRTYRFKKDQLKRSEDVPTSAVDDIIVLDMENIKRKIFVGADPIDEPKTWEMDNLIDEMEFSFVFDMAGDYPQTLPDDFKLPDDGKWDSVGKVWTPGGAGRFVADGVFDGTHWNVEISPLPLV